MRCQQLGIGACDPSGRLLECLGIDIGADRPKKVASRSFHGGMVDAPGPGIGFGRPWRFKHRGAVIVHGHATFASRAHEFLPLDEVRCDRRRLRLDAKAVDPDGRVTLRR